MKRFLFALFVSLVFMTSCQNQKSDSKEKTKPEVAKKFYYVEFVDSCNSPLSQNTISLVKSRIFDKGYILTEESNEWQGVKEIDTTELVELNNLSKSHQSVHRFRSFSEYNSDNADVEKIVITYNNPLNDSIPNFNYQSFKKLGYSEWQSVFNPGNFKYNGTAKPTEIELADWMVEQIVLLTFK